MDDDLGFSALDTAVLREVLWSAPLPAALLDRRKRFRWINQQFPVGSGLPAEAHPGRRPTELWGPNARPVEAMLDQVLATGEDVAGPFAARDAAGRERRFDLTFHALRGPDGAIAGFTCAGMEQTGRNELLHSQSELRRESATDRARLQAVLTHAPVGIAVIDPDGRAMLYSKAVVEMFGEPRIDDQGRAAFDVWDPGGDPVSPGTFSVARTLREGVTVRGQTVEVDGVDGRRLSLLLSSAPVFQRSGYLQFAVLCFTDVTDLREARDALRASQASLESAMERLRRVHVLTAQMATTKNVPDVVGILANFVRADLGAAQARLALLDERQESLVLRATDGWVAATAFDPARAPAGRRAWHTDDDTESPIRFHGGRDELLAEYPELAGEIEDLEVDTWASLPLASSGRTLGVCLVGWLESPWFSPEDRADLELLVTQAAVALDRILLDEQQHKVVETLQVALLPPTLPAVPGLSMMARYRPAGHASAVGGDWFDAFRTTKGSLMMTVGDVAGHGMASAAMMAQLRSAARAYGMEGHDPARILELLDALLASTGEELITSAVVAAIDMDSWTLRWACAGHPPPLLLDGDGVVLLSASKGRVLGLGSSSYQAGERQVPPGATIMLYTDGLVERRNATVGDGIQELRTRLASGAPADLDTLDRLIDEMVADPFQNEDDLCVLLARRTDPAPGG